MFDINFCSCFRGNLFANEHVREACNFRKIVPGYTTVYVGRPKVCFLNRKNPLIRVDWGILEKWGNANLLFGRMYLAYVLLDIR